MPACYPGRTKSSQTFHIVVISEKKKKKIRKKIGKMCETDRKTVARLGEIKPEVLSSLLSFLDGLLIA